MFVFAYDHCCSRFAMAMASALTTWVPFLPTIFQQVFHYFNNIDSN